MKRYWWCLVGKLAMLSQCGWLELCDGLARGGVCWHLSLDPQWVVLLGATHHRPHPPPAPQRGGVGV